MPLVRIDAVAGRSPTKIESLLKGTHRALLTAFKVPSHDRYRIYHEHPASNLVVQNTGLGIERTRDVVVAQVKVKRPRKRRRLFRSQPI